ncbi:hypothetical protein MVEN_02540500 [Mycena venus]|uniref:Uncharacterized protein n=1 Tax=Mycena venus TaxID=2733690 RepID=A0A8H6U2P9_9AGAR|nr:hypothetical protein MVEN_02540500 [Mycena venus]
MPLYTAISRATVPLKSLHLPYQEGGFLDRLAAIASVFPELTELSLEFLELYSIFRCGTGDDYGPGAALNMMRGPPRDCRTLELDDEGAFDGELPVDDISDAESEREDPAPILVMEQAASEPTLARSISSSMSMLQKLFQWIMHDSFALSTNIEVFRVVDRDCQLPPADQHQVIARLSRLYTQLREIKFGSLGSSWKRTGDSWARDVSGAREVILVLREVELDPWMG